MQMRKAILALLAMMLLLSACGESSTPVSSVETESPEQTVVANEPPIVEEPVVVKEYENITVGNLYDVLSENPLRASSLYKENNFAVLGKIGTIDSDGKYFALDDMNSSSGLLDHSVHCNMDSDEVRNELISFNKGELITVKGTISDVGEIMGFYLDVDEIVPADAAFLKQITDAEEAKKPLAIQAADICNMIGDTYNHIILNYPKLASGKPSVKYANIGFDNLDVFVIKNVNTELNGIAGTVEVIFSGTDKKCDYVIFVGEMDGSTLYIESKLEENYNSFFNALGEKPSTGEKRGFGDYYDLLLSGGVVDEGWIIGSNEFSQSYDNSDNIYVAGGIGNCDSEDTIRYLNYVLSQSIDWKE